MVLIKVVDEEKIFPESVFAVLPSL